jgi:hypothetical protein
MRVRRCFLSQVNALVVKTPVRAELFSASNFMDVKGNNKLSDDKWMFELMESTKDLRDPIEKLRTETQTLFRQHAARNREPEQ